MNFLKFTAIPHSESILVLLEFLLFISFSIYQIYWAFTFGTTFSALFYSIKAIYNFDSYSDIAKKYLKILPKGLLSPFGLSIFPFLAFVFILLQFHFLNTSIALNNLIALNFLLLITTLGLIRTFDVVVNKSKQVTKNKVLLFGIITLLFILATIWTSISIYSYYLNPILAINVKTFFSFYTLVHLLYFIFFGFVLGLFAFLFFVIPVVDENFIENEIRNIIHKNIGRGISFGIFLPLILFFTYLSAPQNSVSFHYYLLTILSILILFLALVLFYTALNRINVRLVRVSFYILIISFVVFIGSETTLFAVATKKQKFAIALEYQKFHEELLASAGRGSNTVNGEEIYKAKCVACHQFDTKLVGPPHKEVLLKYKDRQDEMVKFILNPVKVNPDYPPMPAQGLKSNEAEAVVKYMFEHYGPMLK